MDRLHFLPQRSDPRDPGGTGGPPAQGGYPAMGQVDFEEPDDELDYRALFSTLWRGKWIVVICMIFAGILGSLLTTQQTPLFRATATVMFEAPRANLEAGEALVTSTLGNGPINNQIEVLRSASLMQRVVDELDLMASPLFNPTLRPPPEPSWRDRLTVPPQVTDLLIAAGLQDAPLPPGPAPDPDAVNAMVEQSIVQRLQNTVQLVPIENTFVIQISYTSPDRRMAAAIANTVAEQYLVDQLEGKLETFRSATAWLTDRVDDLQVRVEEAEAAVLAAQAEVSDQVGANLQAVQQELAALIVLRSEGRTATSGLSARYERLTAALQSGAGIGALPEFREAPSIQALLEREEELVEEDELLSATLLANHPSRQRLADTLENVRDDIREEAQSLLEALELELRVARDRGVQIDAEIAALEAKELELSTESVEARNLEREAQASRVLYESLLARLQETTAQEDLQSADARILTQAIVPGAPINVSQNRTLIVALVAGLLLGVGVIFLLEKLNNTFRSPGQLEQLSGHPVLATIPQAGSRMKRSDVLQTLRSKPNSSLAEAIRNLRTSILFSNVDTPPKVVMFSSSVPREGKSTTSMLMALTSRQMGKTAIIVDCDLRMPALSKVLQVEDDRPGLLSVIDESATIEEAVYVEPETGLHVLMTRSSERAAKINAADVLASEKFRHLVAELSKMYDLVVLDTPPTLVVTDARIVAGLADATAFCVRWDSTPRAAVKEGLRELASVNARLTGVVMTLVDEKRASRYAYDGYSYYKGHYRDYYEG